MLLLLILAVKMHALMALVIVSVGTAVATRIPVGDIMDVILGGFGETLGEIALLIAFGVMFARLLETSGGSMALSNFLIDKLGEKRAPLALGIASLLFGLPIFFDAAFMVMLPLYLAVARRLGGSMLMYVLPRRPHCRRCTCSCRPTPVWSPPACCSAPTSGWSCCSVCSSRSRPG